ncbi:MAG: hypothetical protein OEV92_09035 [Nitrospinota bacterium]|nr:hypothetical protein [Nitrospinota bacterium]
MSEEELTETMAVAMTVGASKIRALMDANRKGPEDGGKKESAPAAKDIPKPQEACPT